MMRDPDTPRLFYAVLPDAATRAQLAALQDDVGGRKVRTENLHLTLAFLGNQPRSALPILHEVLQGLAFPAMQLQIDRLDYFSKQRIAWAGPSAAPQALFLLQRSLRNALENIPLRLKPVAGFRPHVTLARDAPAPIQKNIAPVQWDLKKIALMESVSSPVNPTAGPVYLSLAEKCPD